MEIKTVLLPIVTDTFESTVEFYKKITGKEVSLYAAHDGYQLSQVDNFVILGAVDGPEALEIPSRVHAIFVVDDLNAFWKILEKKARKIIIPINRVSTGVRFIVEQPDGKVIEYIQTNEN
ncbi:VOC family protein [Sphingobacterium sp. LRF_L2]|uniref:VOC family protein n=1 Tax=Sphingobacterium sp. LRF_L2 TaxID=3369421 RepID=UPI003F5E44DB